MSQFQPQNIDEFLDYMKGGGTIAEVDNSALSYEDRVAAQQITDNVAHGWSWDGAAAQYRGVTTSDKVGVITTDVIGQTSADFLAHYGRLPNDQEQRDWITANIVDGKYVSPQGGNYDNTVSVANTVDLSEIAGSTIPDGWVNPKGGLAQVNDPNGGGTVVANPVVGAPPPAGNNQSPPGGNVQPDNGGLLDSGGNSQVNTGGNTGNQSDNGGATQIDNNQGLINNNQSFFTTNSDTYNNQGSTDEGLISTAPVGSDTHRDYRSYFSNWMSRKNGGNG